MVARSCWVAGVIRITSYNVCYTKLLRIGNGTASRETDTFVADMVKRENLKVQKITVSRNNFV